MRLFKKRLICLSSDYGKFSRLSQCAAKEDTDPMNKAVLVFDLGPLRGCSFCDVTFGLILIFFIFYLCFKQALFLRSRHFESINSHSIVRMFTLY